MRYGVFVCVFLDAVCAYIDVYLYVPVRLNISIHICLSLQHHTTMYIIHYTIQYTLYYILYTLHCS